MVNNKAVCLIRKYQHPVLVRLKPAPGAGVSLAFNLIWSSEPVVFENQSGGRKIGKSEAIWNTVEPLYKNTLYKNTLTKTSIFLCNSRLPKNFLLVNLPGYKNTLTKTSYILMKFGFPSIFL